MGMAASQARLLSITSRMSDNELRAQLINNAKMRLTTDSSRVSDEYIAALNKTQMMFTNFDTMGNEQYQDLTFNSLTAYSSYNNQYGIVNGGGELLVSKSDAEKFEKAGGINGSLETFLNSYGLFKDTTYFDNYKVDNVGYYDTFGNWQDLEVPMSEMQTIFEGGVDSNNITHYGYEANLNSPEYSEYLSLVGDYDAAKDDYKREVEKAKREFVDGKLTLNGKELTVDNKNLQTLFEEVWNLETQTKTLTDSDGESYTVEYLKSSDITTYNQKMRDLLGKLGITVTGTGENTKLTNPAGSAVSSSSQVFLANMLQYLKDSSAVSGSTITNYEMHNEGTPVYGTWDSDGNFTELTTSKVYLSPGPNEITGMTGGQQISFGNDGYRYLYTYQNPDLTAPLSEYNYIELPDQASGYSPAYLKEDPNGTIEKDGKMYSITNEKTGIEYIKEGKSIIARQSTATDVTISSALLEMYKYMQNNLYDNLNEAPFRKITGNASDTEAKYKKYEKAAIALATFIYGEENANKIDPKYYDYLSSPGWVLSQNIIDEQIVIDKPLKDDLGNILTDPNTGEPLTEQVTYTGINYTHYNPYGAGTFPTTTTTDVTFVDENGNTVSTGKYNYYQVVKDAYLIECMLNQYGEPKYTWIDQGNPNENAEAKAQWYTHLFDRMKEGYKEIPENLMGSQEWLQFAFESGLVHMEQVDKSGLWVSTMYSNCSNITESTVDVDVTIAEAKYKREMNKIQAKDKQYDMELKNIDTEHSSLQSEYDSIKSVIDKNVERNFKMFQA